MYVGGRTEETRENPQWNYLWPVLDQTRNLQYPEVREVSPLSQERLANKHVHAHYTATEHYSCLADISSHFAPPTMQ